MYRLYDFYEDQEGVLLLCSESVQAIKRFMHTYTEDTDGECCLKVFQNGEEIEV